MPDDLPASASPADIVRAAARAASPDDDGVRVSDGEREAVVERLRAACADGRLDLAELVERTGIAYAARTRGDLVPVLADLPDAGSAPYPGGGRPEAAGESRFHVVLGAIKRFGSWVLAPRSSVRVVLGEVKLGLGKARVTSEDIYIDAVVILGELKIWVPPGVEVVLTGSSTLGQRSSLVSHERIPGMPRLHVHARVILGEVKIFSRGCPR